jgi:hypothetical protein
MKSLQNKSSNCIFKEEFSKAEAFLHKPQEGKALPIEFGK